MKVSTTFAESLAGTATGCCSMREGHRGRRIDSSSLGTALKGLQRRPAGLKNLWPSK